MKYKQILGHNIQIIQHPTAGSQKFNLLQVKRYGPLNTPLYFGMLLVRSVLPRPLKQKLDSDSD